MALTQHIAQGQEELRILIYKLYQDEYNFMEHTVKIGDQVINQPPMRQEVGLVESRPFQTTATSRAQQRRGRQHRQNTLERQHVHGSSIALYIGGLAGYIERASSKT